MPEAVSFTQTDPIGLKGGVNLYGYASSDPINNSDPLGLCTHLPCHQVNTGTTGLFNEMMNALASHVRWGNQGCLALGVAAASSIMMGNVFAYFADDSRPDEIKYGDYLSSDDSININYTTTGDRADLAATLLHEQAHALGVHGNGAEQWAQACLQ